MKTQIKIRTRYQRMLLASKAAEILTTHNDPAVQELGLVIKYALGAPIATLNNVLDQFPKEIRTAIVEAEASTNAGENLLFQLRKARASVKAKTGLRGNAAALKDEEVGR